MTKRLYSPGFTIVELVVVVVVIAILASISVVGYTGITKNAQDTVTKAELRQSGQKLEAHRMSKGSYPSSLSEADVTLNSATMTHEYSANSSSFCLTVRSTQYADIIYSITQDMQINSAACTAIALPPLPAIPVATIHYGQGPLTFYIDWTWPATVPTSETYTVHLRTYCSNGTVLKLTTSLTNQTALPGQQHSTTIGGSQASWTEPCAAPRTAQLHYTGQSTGRVAPVSTITVP